MRSVLAVLVVVLLGTLAAPLHAPPQSAASVPQVGALGGIEAVTLGETRWVCGERSVPDAYVNALLWPTPRRRETVYQHERAHIAGAAGMTCEQWHAAWLDPAWAAAQEAMGFCAGAQEGARNGYFASLEQGMRAGAADLAGAPFYRRFGLTQEGAYQLIAAACGVTW